jgi:hypothetical protein
MKALRIAVLGLVLGPYLLAADINGRWEGSMKARDGNPENVQMDLKAEEGKLSGTLVTPQGETDITNGQVDGEYILFNVMRTVDGHEVTQRYRGHVNGEVINFTLQTVGNGGERNQSFNVRKVGG